MNVWAKFDGDKQKYRSQSEVRCTGAGLRMNEGLTWAPGTWEKIISAPACAAFTRMNESKCHKVNKDQNKNLDMMLKCQGTS